MTYVTRCPIQPLAVCLLSAFWRCLRARGAITFRVADIGDDMGRTRFETNEILLSPNLTAGEVRATIAHELAHLERGPVPPAWVEQEEVAVRAETARDLVPEASLQRLESNLTEEEIRLLQRLYDVDRDTALTAALQARRPGPLHRDDSGV